MVQSLWKRVLQFLTEGPAILFPEIHPKGRRTCPHNNFYTRAHRSIICSGRRWQQFKCPSVGDGQTRGGTSTRWDVIQALKPATGWESLENSTGPESGGTSANTGPFSPPSSVNTQIPEAVLRATGLPPAWRWGRV